MPLEVTLTVDGWPPAKNEAKSLLSAGHSHAERVVKLLEAAQHANQNQSSAVLFGSRPIGLDLTVSSPAEPTADATNFLGGVGDVLEVRDRQGLLEHLGALANVGLYDNDRQIHEIRYRWRRKPIVSYVVKLRELSD